MHAGPLTQFLFSKKSWPLSRTIIFCCNSHTSCSYYGGSRESDDEQLEDQ